MLIIFERKVPQSSYTSQNDHKSKGYPSKTAAAAFTMQKSDKGDLRRLEHPPLKQTFKNPTFQSEKVHLVQNLKIPNAEYKTPSTKCKRQQRKY